MAKVYTPGDAKMLLLWEQFGTDSLIAPFSSHGVMTDGRIKPDLVSVGKQAITIGKMVQ